jgi:hypothetical protein
MIIFYGKISFYSSQVTVLDKLYNFNVAIITAIINLIFSQLQIVMKQGLVEIATTGLIPDFDDAILITREQIESVNEQVKVSTFYTRNNR